MYLPIFSNISDQNWLDKHVFNNVSRLNRSCPIKNTVRNKIKRFPQLFPLSQQIPLKQKWHYFLPWSTIRTELNIYIYKCKEANICKCLVQPISLVIIKYLIGFLALKNPCLHHNFVTLIENKLSVFSICTQIRELWRYKINNWFLSVTLHNTSVK